MHPGRTVIFIVKPSGPMRAALATHLQSHHVLVASTIDLPTTARVLSARPDVVLVSTSPISGDPLTLVASLNRELPYCRVIMVDVTPLREAVIAYLKAGVRGFVVKDAALPEYERAVRVVLSGGYVIPQIRTATRSSAPATVEVLSSIHLTSREREVATLLANGLGDDELHRRLTMTPETMRAHVQNILEKITLHTRLNTARRASRPRPAFAGRQRTP